MRKATKVEFEECSNRVIEIKHTKSVIKKHKHTVVVECEDEQKAISKVKKGVVKKITKRWNIRKRNKGQLHTHIIKCYLEEEALIQASKLPGELIDYFPEFVVISETETEDFIESTNSFKLETSLEELLESLSKTHKNFEVTDDYRTLKNYNDFISPKKEVIEHIERQAPDYEFVRYNSNQYKFQKKVSE